MYHNCIVCLIKKKNNQHQMNCVSSLPKVDHFLGQKNEKMEEQKNLPSHPPKLEHVQLLDYSIMQMHEL